jgi:flagella basal body P-ring formation protein FlgA
MSLLPTALLLLATAGPAPVDTTARVPAADIVQAATNALIARASVEHVEADFTVASHVLDLRIPAGKQLAGLEAAAPPTWLRPRAAVPVRVRWADGSSTSTLVWFAITAPSEGLVYAQDFPQGAAGDSIAVRNGPVDLARTHAAPAVAVEALSPLRLRHAVHAGAPALAADFQPMPAVRAQQGVRIDATIAGVHLSVKGRALVDGALDQVISVLPSNATQPVQARVVSAEVVVLED